MFNSASIPQSNDYHPFGMVMPGRSYTSSGGEYRFGFNGKEDDREWGTSLIQDYGFRLYNPALGKFLSVDPLFKGYPYYTPYQFAGNKPIWAIDLDGLEEQLYIYTIWKNSEGKVVTNVKSYEGLEQDYVNLDGHRIDKDKRGTLIQINNLITGESHTYYKYSFMESLASIRREMQGDSPGGYHFTSKYGQGGHGEGEKDENISGIYNIDGIMEFISTVSKMKAPGAQPPSNPPQMKVTTVIPTANEVNEQDYQDKLAGDGDTVCCKQYNSVHILKVNEGDSSLGDLVPNVNSNDYETVDLEH